MQYIKTYLSTAPVLTTLWFGSLAGLLRHGDLKHSPLVSKVISEAVSRDRDLKKN